MSLAFEVCAVVLLFCIFAALSQIATNLKAINQSLTVLWMEKHKENERKENEVLNRVRRTAP